MRGLLTIAEAAEKFEIPSRTLFKRLMAARESYPDLLVSFSRPGAKVGKWFVREAVLRKLIEGEP